MLKEECQAPAEINAADAGQQLAGDLILLQQIQDCQLQIERLASELAATRLELSTALQDFSVTRQNVEASLPVLEAGSHQSAAAVDRLETIVSDLSYQLAQQQQEAARSTEALAALQDAESNRNNESIKTLAYWGDLNGQILRVEVDIAKWKKIVMIGGMIFCVVITVMLFIIFKF